jgi:arylsulfatase A-like enzyme
MRPPNVIVIVSDDQGYGDMSCMGNPNVATPHLDALAAGGARFSSFYAASPVCSPSRAALLTGRYPGNAGVRAILAGHRTASGLPPHVPTLATLLRNNGYQTALSGKWHLGVARESRPHAHGFNEWFGFLAGCVDYYSHIFYWGMNQPGVGVNPTHDLWHNDQEVYANGRYLTELITEFAVGFIERAAATAQPFLLYLPYNAPHYPMHAPQHYLQRFPDLPWDRQIMAAMLAAMDDGVGAVMATLERLGLRDNTLVFFQSDNGPSRESRNWLDGTLDPYYGGTAGGLKGHKFSLFEGGIRVPGLLSWPAQIPAGQVIAAPVAAIDILPTIVEAVGLDAQGYELDGQSLLALLQHGRPLAPRDLFWEMEGQTAIRRGDWKLTLNGRLVEGMPPEDAVFLANLAEDVGEQHNLYTRHAVLSAELQAAAEAWRAQIEERWQHEFLMQPSGTTAHSL